MTNIFKVKTNVDYIEETYYEYHGKYDEGSEKEEFYGFHIIEETEVETV